MIDMEHLFDSLNSATPPLAQADDAQLLPSAAARVAVGNRGRALVGLVGVHVDVVLVVCGVVDVGGGCTPCADRVEPFPASLR
jgi:hypothetical protein